MLKINNLSFSYGEKEVLRDFSMEMQKGERICLFGQSGCGKTTLLRLVMGLEKPKSGKLSCKAQGIAPVFQEDRLIESYTVLQNINFGCKRDGMEILKAVGLEDLAQSYPAQLSGGQKRRVALARALNFDSELLILDEAFNGLDAQTADLCIAAIERFAGDRAILMVSHNRAYAQKLNATILQMHV